MPQIVWIARTDGWNVYLNKRWTEYTGLTLEESLGVGWNKQFHPDDQQRAWDAWQVAAATIGTYSLECRLRRADGVYRWWLIRGEPLPDAAGTVLSWCGTCTDVDDLKHAAHETSGSQLENEKRFDRMLANLNLVALTLDLRGRITYCNDYLLGMTGWTREEVVGGSWFDLFLPPDHGAMRGTFSSLIADAPEAWHHENEILTKAGGRRLIRWNNSLLRSPSGEVVGTSSIGEDVTDHSAHPGSSPAGAEDGGGRPPGGRRRPRLQQRAGRHPGVHRAPAAPGGRGAAGQARADPEGHATRLRPHPPAPGLQPEADRGPEGAGPQRPRCRTSRRCSAA